MNLLTKFTYVVVVTISATLLQQSIATGSDIDFGDFSCSAGSCFKNRSSDSETGIEALIRNQSNLVNQVCDPKDMSKSRSQWCYKEQQILRHKETCASRCANALCKKVGYYGQGTCSTGYAVWSSPEINNNSQSQDTSDGKNNGGKAESFGKGFGQVTGGVAGAKYGGAPGGAVGSQIGAELGAAGGRVLDKNAEENKKSGRGGTTDPRYTPSFGGSD